jgi:hypothetical protein
MSAEHGDQPGVLVFYCFLPLEYQRLDIVGDPARLLNGRCSWGSCCGCVSWGYDRLGCYYGFVRGDERVARGLLVAILEVVSVLIDTVDYVGP